MGGRAKPKPGGWYKFYRGFCVEIIKKITQVTTKLAVAHT